ncbi:MULTISPECIES: hypothetical protein [unclassified Myroides]|uniref:hypothetical protein n=1 Tax=unclassified Myroides TaxID=2642485 RepID=UPI0015FB508D|nr:MULTISPECIES: hypothetical protein [unclassified Myroides]MBB1148856.1 hypothetical protein [Myroides sp. NP-2]MDM1406568.1 hypothetical protein [Myroides sp. DF42-4-2]
MKNVVIKFSLFTVIYILFSWIIANDFVCALKGDPLCMQNVAIRYIIFIVLMVVYEKWVKDKVFKRKEK